MSGVLDKSILPQLRVPKRTALDKAISFERSKGFLEIEDGIAIINAMAKDADEEVKNGSILITPELMEEISGIEDFDYSFRYPVDNGMEEVVWLNKRYILDDDGRYFEYVERWIGVAPSDPNDEVLYDGGEWLYSISIGDILTLKGGD